MTDTGKETLLEAGQPINQPEWDDYDTTLYYDDVEQTFDTAIDKTTLLFPETQPDETIDRSTDQTTKGNHHDSTDHKTIVTNEHSDTDELLDEKELADIERTLGAIAKVESETGKGFEYLELNLPIILSSPHNDNKCAVLALIDSGNSLPYSVLDKQIHQQLGVGITKTSDL